MDLKLDKKIWLFQTAAEELCERKLLDPYVACKTSTVASAKCNISVIFNFFQVLIILYM